MLRDWKTQYSSDVCSQTGLDVPHNLDQNFSRTFGEMDKLVFHSHGKATHREKKNKPRGLKPPDLKTYHKGKEWFSLNWKIM